MANTFKAINPKTNEDLPGDFIIASENEIDAAVKMAQAAFDTYKKTSKDEKADFLDQIATEIEALGDRLIERGMLETALPEGRLKGERGRTCNQLRLFANVVREGSWVDARIDPAMPERTPPRADIRHMMRPLGPVAVFGASNFPLAFSTAGGDTASALAAGCPVIVKGHPAHPGTTALVSEAIQTAANKSNLPAGIFTMVQGNTNAVGQYLITHPGIKAVGFTGSFRGGKAIYDAANTRDEIIPVYAEMGSTNPVFILPGALKEKSKDIASGLAGSINVGVGQFCTNPGLTFIPGSVDANLFFETLNGSIGAVPPTTMLTPGIKKSYDHGTNQLLNENGITKIAEGQSEQGHNQAVSKVFRTQVKHFIENSDLEEEVFGPSSIMVDYNSKEDILNAAKGLKGHLTATVHGTPEDLSEHKDLLDILENKVGRVIINGYPTGVEVCHAMVHGGPFPSTTAPWSTSVGTGAIKRFARPVCFQGYSDDLLPLELKNGNPLGIWRMVNGEMNKNKI